MSTPTAGDSDSKWVDPELLLAATGRDDVHDAALALVCEPNDTLLTSDIDDLAALLTERRKSPVGMIKV